MAPPVYKKSRLRHEMQTTVGNYSMRSSRRYRLRCWLVSRLSPALITRPHRPKNYVVCLFHCPAKYFPLYSAAASCLLQHTWAYFHWPTVNHLICTCITQGYNRIDYAGHLATLFVSMVNSVPILASSPWPILLVRPLSASSTGRSSEGILVRCWGERVERTEYVASSCRAQCSGQHKPFWRIKMRMMRGYGGRAGTGGLGCLRCCAYTGLTASLREYCIIISVWIVGNDLNMDNVPLGRQLTCGELHSSFGFKISEDTVLLLTRGRNAQFSAKSKSSRVRNEPRPTCIGMWGLVLVVHLQNDMKPKKDPSRRVIAPMSGGTISQAIQSPLTTSSSSVVDE